MRNLGDARASAFFGSAPFVGTIISLILFRAMPGINFIFKVNNVAVFADTATFYRVIS
jgi:hypothetical protein